jgi:hypothetical protein
MWQESARGPWRKLAWDALKEPNKPRRKLGKEDASLQRRRQSWPPRWSYANGLGGRVPPASSDVVPPKNQARPKNSSRA